MNKKLSFMLALAVLAAAGASFAATRPAPARAPEFRLGTTQYSDAYCSRLARRCDQGDANACALYAKGCGL